MTQTERLTKTLLFLMVMAYYLGGYFLLNYLTSYREHHFQLALPFEDKLPFYPALIGGYILIFGFLAFTYIYVEDLAYFKKIVRVFLICLTIHFAIFLLLPVEYRLRPEVDPTLGWAYRTVHFYYWLDRPYNCFPSMHISNAFLVAFLLDRYRKGFGWILHPLAATVAVSVVLVKQHYIADVVAGFIVAWLVMHFFFKGTDQLIDRVDRSKSAVLEAS